MQIGKISLHTTNTSKTNNNCSPEKKLASNPFGVSFKGNVIQADVFEGTKKAGIGKSISEKSKLFASAVVSGINNFNEAFKSRMNSVVSFGKKITTNVFDTIEKFGNTEITFDMTGIKNKLFPNRQYSVKNLASKDVSELKTLWQDLAGIQAA